MEQTPTPHALIWVDVPVFRGGRVVYDLRMLLLADRLPRILAAQNLPPDWAAGVADRNGLNIAHIQNAERFVGRKVSPGVLNLIGSGDEGVGEATSLEGVRYIGAYLPADRTGFVVAVAFPASLVCWRRWEAASRPGGGVAVMLVASGQVASSCGGPRWRAIRELPTAATHVQDGTENTELRIQGS